MGGHSTETQGICIRQKMGVPSISYWSVPDNGLENQVPQWHRPMLAEITPLNLRLISMGLVVIAPPCLLYACPKVILASSFISLCSFEYICFGLPFLHTLQLGFFSTVTVSPGPTSFPPISLTDSRMPPWALTLSSHTLCSISQPFGQGTVLSPTETHCCDCLLLMSASPHHLGKEGKIHKRDGKCISFSFYSTLF